MIFLSIYKCEEFYSLQTREGKSVRRSPLFCFDILKNGIIREVAEKFVFINVLNGKEKMMRHQTVRSKHSRPFVQHE